MTTFTGPVIGAGRTILQSYMDNQKAAADLAKVYGTDPTKDYRSSLAALQKAFEALSTEFGVSQSEVTGIAASWAAAGLQGTALAESVQNTLRTMVIGDMSATDATNALIAIQAAYGASSQDLTGIINDLNAVENQTGITMEGLIQGFQRSAASAAGAGIDVRHLAAMLAAITPAAGTATQAGNALKTIIDKILVSSASASPLLKQMGIDVNSAGWVALNATDRLQKLALAFSGLTQQQKAQVSTAAANLYQINRFDQLMQDMANYLNGTANATSYYGAALKATESPTKAAQIAQKELQTVLQSQPQMLAEIGAALKNQLMDTIKPLIPVILSMADALLQLAQWFGRLNPNIQKFVGIAILTMAILGPVLLYVSALGSAFHYFGDVVGFILKPFGALLGLFGGGAASDMAATEAALTKIDGSLGKYAASAQAATEEVVASNDTQALSWRTTQAEIIEVLRQIELNTRVTAAVMFDMWVQAMGGMATTTESGMLAINAATEAGMARQVEIVGAATVAIEGETITGAAGAEAGSAGIFSRMFSGITGVFGKIFSFLGGLGPKLMGLIFSPWGLAIAAVVGLMLLFPNQVKAAFDYVVKIVEAAAKAIYGFFQYINPFAHHSPSLVENVTQGMAIVAAAFGTVTDIQAPVMAAYNTVTQFSNAVAGLAVTARNIDFNTGLKALTSQGGTAEAIALYKQLYAQLDQLQAKAADLNGVIQQQQIVVDADKAALDGANASLSAQQSILDGLTKTQTYWDDLVTKTNDDIQKLSSTGIVGQQAMGDQIFANTQQQKALQLQMMQMEDTTGPIDDATSALAALQGQIESLQGEQKSLRESGAGSEITGGIQGQIDQLTAQQTATNSSVAAYDALSKQLDTLQRQGQELDLTNSLDFDGLTRQIQQAATAMTEMPFDQIMAGIDTDKTALAGYTAQYTAATTAVNAQQTAVDALTAQRDALQAVYDTENGKLQALQDSYGKVNDAISAINSSLTTMQDNASKATQAASAAGGGLNPNPSFATANLGNSLSSSDSTDGLQDLIDSAQKQSADIFGKLDMLGPFKKAYKKVTDWAKTNLGGGSEIGADVSNLVDTINTKVKGVDWSGLYSNISPVVNTIISMGKTVGILGGAFGQLMTPDIKTFFKEMAKYAEELWQQIGPKLIPLVAAASKVFSDLWTIIKPLVIIFGITLIGALKIWMSTMNGVMGPLLKLVAQTIGNMIKTLTDFLKFLDDVFHGRWGAAWDDIKDIFITTWNEIEDLFTGVWNAIVGGVEGFVNGVVGFFTWLYDELVGHSIIPDLMDAIVGFFTGLPARIFAGISALVGDIASFFANVASSAYTAVSTGFQNTLGFFNNIKGWIVGAFTGAGSWLLGIGSSLIGGLFSGITSAVNAAGGLVSTVASNIAGGIKTALDTVLHLPWSIPRIELPTSPFTSVGFGPWTLIPKLAGGGIFDKATQAIVGEAGREAVIPLTNPSRAWQLVQASGLLNIIGPYMTAALANGVSAPSTAFARVGSVQSNQASSPTIQYADNSTSHVYNFNGDLSFPNVTNGMDAEDFLKNLEVLARKGS